MSDPNPSITPSDACAPDPGDQTRGEEIANAITHGLAAVVALAGGAAMVWAALAGGDPWRIWTLALYSLCLVLLYVASAGYHACRPGPRKLRWRKLDHAAIYLLIAGSYTPFMLVSLRGGWGWTIFVIVWTLALLGTLFKLFHAGRFPVLSTAIYLLMGWVGIAAIKPMFAQLPQGCMGWIFAGGAAYTVGVIFYVWERLPYNHAVWHLFVAGGSVCHFLALVWYVLPIA